jgi:IclR family acetate operon transcriptional repressor
MVVEGFSTPEQAEPLLQVMELPRFTPRTITSLPKLRLELKKIRESGFAIDDQENTPGVRCVAAPIFNRGGALAGALSLTGPVQQLTDDRLIKVAEKVREAARQMTNTLGGNTWAASRRSP